MVHQLIDAGINKSHELDLADRLQPLCRHADAESADKEFGKRRIEHAFRSETLLQADGGAEDAAVDSDILAEHDDIGVILRVAGARKPPPLTPTSAPNTTTLGSSSIARASAMLTASTSVISVINPPFEFAALRGIGPRQFGIRMIEHGLGGPRFHSQIALDRRVDVLQALGE